MHIYGKTNSQQHTNSSWKCKVHHVKSLAENAKNNGVLLADVLLLLGQIYLIH